MDIQIPLLISDYKAFHQQQRIIRKMIQKRRQFARFGDPDKVEQRAIAAAEAHRLELAKQRGRKLRRAIHLAVTFLRHDGAVPYKAIEAKNWSPPDWNEIGRIIDSTCRREELDERHVNQRFAEWLSEGGVNIEVTIEVGPDGIKHSVRDVNWRQPPPKPKKARPSRGAGVDQTF